MSVSKVQSNLDKLRTIYIDDPASQYIIDDYERKLRRAIVESELAKSDGAQMLIESAQKKINQINYLLMNGEDLDTESRKALFRAKEVHMWYLERLTGKTSVEIIESIGQITEVYIEKSSD